MKAAEGLRIKTVRCSASLPRVHACMQDNYLIAMINKQVLPMHLPPLHAALRAGGAAAQPSPSHSPAHSDRLQHGSPGGQDAGGSGSSSGGGEAGSYFLTKTLEWNLRWWVRLQPPFAHPPFIYGCWQCTSQGCRVEALPCQCNAMGWMEHGHHHHYHTYTRAHALRRVVWFGLAPGAGVCSTRCLMSASASRRRSLHSRRSSHDVSRRGPCMQRCMHMHLCSQ